MHRRLFSQKEFRALRRFFGPLLACEVQRSPLHRGLAMFEAYRALKNKSSKESSRKTALLNLSLSLLIIVLVLFPWYYASFNRLYNTFFSVSGQAALPSGGEYISRFFNFFIYYAGFTSLHLLGPAAYPLAAICLFFFFYLRRGTREANFILFWLVIPGLFFLYLYLSNINVANVTEERFLAAYPAIAITSGFLLSRIGRNARFFALAALLMPALLLMFPMFGRFALILHTPLFRNDMVILSKGVFATTPYEVGLQAPAAQPIAREIVQTILKICLQNVRAPDSPPSL